MTELKEGDWVEIPPDDPEEVFPLRMIGQIQSVWPPFARVSVSVGGSRRVFPHRIDQLKPLKEKK